MGGDTWLAATYGDPTRTDLDETATVSHRPFRAALARDPRLVRTTLRDMSNQQQLAALLDVQDLVTFRWYAQQMDVPVEQAKEELQQFADDHRGDVNAVYLIGGSLKSDSGSRRWAPRA